ncbi:MAG: SemiSWEET transporter [Methylotetracoccus sp.]|jgi:MtN3 and saliva related transmembrane protein|nr:SemiSWEET transporter [Methylotetracoccus sp.]
MMLTDLVGYVAALLTTLSFLPQVLKIWRTKRADDISAPAFAAFSLGVVLWLIYGLALRSWPIILANGVTLLLTMAILALTARYRGWI